MDGEYMHRTADRYWQQRWLDTRAFSAGTDNTRPKYTIIPMFPYPSGKLHMGHVRAYSIGDIVARYKRRRGFNVLHAFGWDAFGLPAENEAIARNIPPQESIERNIRVARAQIQAIGVSYDWEREINTSAPSFDQWTQWIFLQLFKAGLAYRKRAPVNWCPGCMTTLANEQVTDGRCERCDTQVEVRELEQWFFRVTAFASELDAALDGLSGWPERIRRMQRSWIGHAVGALGTRQFHIRDWLISRQRYWGAPIPVVHCARCGIVPVPEEQLPLTLPVIADFRPKGVSPLETVAEWVETTCPACGGSARRETDTMDTFVSSSWYYLRYLSPQYAGGIADPGDVKYWMPVDLYIGGPEHATVHLIYTRFMMRALKSLGIIDFAEPVKQLFVQGIVTMGGRKMSKSRGNAVSQDEIVEKYGADVARVFALSVAPPDQDVEWSNNGIEGIDRFLKRVWRLAREARPEMVAERASSGAEPAGQGELAGKADDAECAQYEQQSDACGRIPRAGWYHRVVMRVTEDIEAFRFNTAITALMQLGRDIEQGDVPLVDGIRTLVQLLSPFAPHIVEQIWHEWGHTTSVHGEPWPEYDPRLAVLEIISIPVQVDGRVRAVIEIGPDDSEREIISRAMAHPKVSKHVSAAGGPDAVKTIFVPGKVLSIVTR